MRAVATEQPLTAPERAAAFLRALATGRLIRARSVAMVVAHPDDEAIGAGAQLPRLNGVTMIHVTDGAPRSPRDAERHGLSTAAEYAFARARELERVMMLAGIPVADRFCLGLADQEAALHLPRIARALVRLFLERATEIVLTHSYEGGHPDHDVAAFAAHAAVELLRREGREIAIIEMPFYRADGEGWAVQRFARAPDEATDVRGPSHASRDAGVVRREHRVLPDRAGIRFRNPAERRPSALRAPRLG